MVEYILRRRHERFGEGWTYGDILAMHRSRYGKEDRLKLTRLYDLIDNFDDDDWWDK